MNNSAKTKQILERLTIEEKAALLSGKNVWESQDIPRFGIPSVICSDGPNGVRRQVGDGDHLGLNASLPATCFPTAATVANSWNVDLAEEIGAALGEEAVSMDVDFLLGPGLNIKRSPLCGRNFEYFSEDPYLSGKLAAGYVRGIQSKGIGACPKHFAVNSQETRRMAMNSVLDERTLREIYLTGFEMVVKEAKPLAIMSSYNEVNGVYANENRHLLREILREDWGFEGIVITDWGASNDHTAGVAAGSNLEMPAPGHDSAIGLIRAYEKGEISMEEIDACVGELLEIIGRLESRNQNLISDMESHHALARKAAEESIVLLKNEDGLLPLDSSKKVAVIGDFAGEPRYQGAGSSNVNCTKLENICDLIREYPIKKIGYARGYQRNSEPKPELEKEALALAKQADLVLFFFGLDEIRESEGMDRLNMKLPANQVSLLEALAAQGTVVIGVLSGGASVEMPWEGCCRAIVHGYLGGQAGASAMLNVLTGKVNPSGKLSETYPFQYEDTPAYGYFPGKNRDAQYRESIYTGYRYYSTVQKAVRYPFGYGLSYTSFAYSDLTVSEDRVTFVLKNTGKRDGAEIAQLYVGCKNGAIFRPAKELKGFCKVFLKAGESRKVEIPLDDKAFRYWNVKTNRWEIETAVYELMVGAGSEDIRLRGELPVQGTQAELPYEKENMKAYYSGKVSQVSDEEFAVLMGGTIPKERPLSGDLTINDAICQMRYAKSALARLIFRILNGLKEKSEREGKPNLNILFIYNMPFRGIAKMTNGAVSMKMAEGMVTAVNGHLLKGLFGILKGYLENRKACREFAQKLE